MLRYGCDCAANSFRASTRGLLVAVRLVADSTRGDSTFVAFDPRVDSRAEFGGKRGVRAAGDAKRWKLGMMMAESGWGFGVVFIAKGPHAF